MRVPRAPLGALRCYAAFFIHLEKEKNIFGWKGSVTTNATLPFIKDNSSLTI
jgi:hypothetical protein